MGEFDAVGTAAALPDVIEGIRAALEPLHAERYADLQEKLGQGSMERAKMDVLLAYTINDLIWVYMRMKGLDPASHDVSSELERIKTYYAKVKAIEEGSDRRRKIDVAAAGRFIKHHLPSSRDSPSSTPAVPTPDVSAEEAAALDRVSNANRFRFVAAEAEKFTPGTSSPEPPTGEEEVDPSRDTTPITDSTQLVPRKVKRKTAQDLM